MSNSFDIAKLYITSDPYGTIDLVRVSHYISRNISKNTASTLVSHEAKYFDTLVCLILALALSVSVPIFLCFCVCLLDVVLSTICIRLMA